MQFIRLKNINFFFLSLFLSFLVSCNQNNNFFVIYNEFSEAFPSDLIKTSDGGFIISGWGRSSNSFSASNGIAIKLDPDGKSEWAREYGRNSSFDKFNFAISLGGGEYFLGGTKNSQTWIIKINANGDILFEKIFVSSLSNTSEDACYDPISNSLFIVGTSLIGDKDVAILVVDNSGDVLSQKIFRSFGDENIFSCNIDNSDSALILTGSKYAIGENGMDGLVMKFDFNGDFHWERTFGGAGGEVIWDSEIDNEGNYVFSGNSTFSASGTSATILKLNKAGRMIHNEYFENTPNSAAKNIIKRLDNSFTVIGRAGEHSGHKNNMLLILNLNKNGDFVSHKVVSKQIGLEGKIAIETNSGEILVAGSSSQRNIFTIKITQ